uniref:Uncharacterized protein n=1 Tax=Arundo donax TaxID=35708 RepID=A0A0A9F621_ARUDO
MLCVILVQALRMFSSMAGYWLSVSSDSGSFMTLMRSGSCITVCSCMYY